MIGRILMACAVAFAGAASAQGLEPGEWEFTTTMSSPMLPKPQSMTVKRCITKQESDNPEKWAGGQKAQTDCKVNYAKGSSGVMTWEMNCPKSKMTGTGSARIGRGSMESELQMRGDMQGRKFEMLTKTSGRRLGPCKS